MAGFIRLLYWAIIIYLVYAAWKLIRRLGQKPGSSTRPQGANRLPGRMVKDEACNTYLPVEDALKETYDGKEYYFCSKACRQKFLDSQKGSA